jgi:hypothetical protein
MVYHYTRRQGRGPSPGTDWGKWNWELKEHCMTQRRYVDETCWFDVFERPYFDGKLNRHFGPIELSSLSAASVIVGPEAQVEIRGKRGGKPVVVRLGSKKLVPDFKKILKGMKIESACLRRTVAKPDKDK